MNNKRVDYTYIFSLHEQRNCILVQLPTYRSSELETTKNRKCISVEMTEGNYQDNHTHNRESECTEQQRKDIARLEI